MKKDKNLEFCRAAINKMLELAGHPYTIDTLGSVGENWYSELTITPQQHEEWRKWYFDNYPRRASKKLKLQSFGEFDFGYGLSLTAGD